MASLLERKAANLHHEGFGKIKVALASPNTLSLLDILEGAFCHTDLDTTDTTSSISNDIPTQEAIVTEKLSKKPPEKIPIVHSGESSLASAKLVFPLKSVSPVIHSLPELLLPLCGPDTLSLQVPASLL